ncbi:lipoprotein [Campylobacterota bacterium]|nr:lipoprotein [Campylobacterota bacterium]
MKYLPLLLTLLVCSGCSKLIVFEPGRIESHLGYDARLDEAVVQRTDSGVQLADGTIISSKTHGVQSLPNGFALAAIDEGFVTATDRDGAVIVYAPDGSSRRYNFPETIIAASANSKVLATVSRTNACRVTSLADGKLIYLSQEKIALSVNEKVARPLITESETIFGTLDGKILIVDHNAVRLKNEYILSNEEFFANIIFLGRVDGVIIAASSTKMVAFRSQVITREIESRYVAQFASGLYAFTRDGTILRLNNRLENEHSARINYAHFVTAAQSKNTIFAVEQSGYIITIDTDLKNHKVYEMPDVIRAPFFATDNELYFGNKIIYWRQ